MKLLLFFPIYFLIVGYTYAQSGQTKKFYVNAFTTLKKDSQSDPERMCEGFNVQITDQRINLGDDIDLLVTSKRHYPSKGQTFYWVDDRVSNGQVCVVVLLIDQNGDNYIQIHTCDSKGEYQYDGGMLFQYLDYVSFYELWRARRRDPN